MGLSVLHIKSEVECHVYLFDEEKGIAHAGTYFNLDVRKGEQDLLFVSVDDETVRYRLLCDVAENDSDYRITITKSQFKHYSPEILAEINKAEQGDTDAQVNLGNCYWNGNGIEQNHEEAVTWFRKAAEQGDAVAQYNLGLCYEYGNGVEQNNEETVKWYRKAAEQGEA
ncbi:MAG: sel1 repeat family protein, partial [Bacteroidales bacterium]|nr:sel1 repeat family protein [Bacteroidales bacterium]